MKIQEVTIIVVLSICLLVSAFTNLKTSNDIVKMANDCKYLAIAEGETRAFIHNLAVASYKRGYVDGWKKNNIDKTLQVFIQELQEGGFDGSE